ncbi:MAG TPA: pitrilysin family protein [Candidatus Eisenbacteria bacterium]|nr:pitrilysin family protein [Candidatus Eisenbacteria bacterium]
MTGKGWTRGGVALFVLAGLALGTAAALAAPADLLLPKEGRLKNGLRVLTLEDPKAAVLSFQVWYDVGSRNERPGITGISHLFEHMMFKGSKNVGPEEHSRLIQAAGGQDNAYTTWDVTVYYEDVPADQLELCARLESDRMSTLRLTPENLKSEREVVKEERRYRVDSQPIGQAIEEMTALAYMAHPYHWPTLGWPSDLDAISLDDVKSYYAIHYAPDKATIVVCGPVTHEQVMKVVEKYFGSLKPGLPSPPVVTVEPVQEGERRSEVQAIVQLPIVIAGYKVPPDSSSDTPAIEVANRILSNGESSRLYKKLVYEDQSALFAGGFTLGRKNPGLFYAFAAVKPGKDRKAVEDTLFHVIDDLGHNGPTDEELTKAKNQAESELLFGLEGVEDRASAVGQAALITGDVKAASRQLDEVRKVTVDDVRRVVATYLQPTQRTLVWLVPKEGAAQ